MTNFELIRCHWTTSFVRLTACGQKNFFVLMVALKLKRARTKVISATTALQTSHRYVTYVISCTVHTDKEHVKFHVYINIPVPIMHSQAKSDISNAPSMNLIYEATWDIDFWNILKKRLKAMISFTVQIVSYKWCDWHIFYLAVYLSLVTVIS